MAPKKINIKERFTDGEIDLSMSDLAEVPVKDIANLKKARTLDLSNNRIVLLPPTFPTLVNITKIDLSKNELTELPENFGDLVRLKYLDLFQNKLQYLPLSFYKLKDLKWLDLNNNPLVPSVAEVAGQCSDSKQCQDCAKRVVSFFSKLQQQVQTELEERNRQRLKQLELNNQKKQEEKKNKKKEKQKNKEKVEKVQAVEKVPSNNVEKIKTEPKKPQEKSSTMKSLLIFVFFLFTTLFVLTSVKLKQTEQFELAVKSGFNKIVINCPPTYQQYFSQFANHVYNVHQKTGNYTMEFVNYVHNGNLRNAVTDLIDNVNLRIQTIYNSVLNN